ncbi:Uma2 family endonuclease [Spirulina sp. CS-785/01]|uniref:Uma2 family endonuclease n=1 Tax=Spirulina sp. CS-785/01 TaxID=3021716 RepID=UPI00232C1690|nr:Uma2 family endonuclease [Spirulina sp. CS-785/01]MDB9312426.1 Uma2 family endonuclease [Spirulina sp. CS-785/01]
MTSTTPTTSITFEDFISHYGDNEQYELIDGELIDIEPTGVHEQVGAFISRKLNVQIDRLNVPYFIPHRCLIRPLGTVSAFRPDVIVLDEEQLRQEPLWTREPIITRGETVKLVVEVVSTNWQNDYARKYEDYETLAIPEYWIIDYLGIGGKYYIGSPKQPTITLCQLIDGAYQKTILRGGEQIQSPLFPELHLNTNQLFAFNI